MRKIKAILFFTCTVFAMVMIFCVSASAAENYDYRTGEIEFKFDKDTGVMTIEGTGGTIRSCAFGPGISNNPEVLEMNIKDTDSLTGEYQDGDYAEFWDYTPNADAAEAAAAAKIVIIDDSVTALEPGCFSHFTNAETIILPDNIKNVPTAAFYSLKNLKTVVLSYQTASIGSYAFTNCKNLKTVNITGTVKSVGKYAFWGCDLNCITIPETVENLGEGNSYVPENLTEVETDSVYNNRVFLEWEEVSDAQIYTKYRVFKRVNGKWKTLADIGSTYKMIDGLEPDTSYTFAVRPFNQVNGKKYFSEKYVKITVRTAPDRPILNVASTKAGAVAFTWNNVEGETGYQIWYSTKENGKYTKISNYKANTVKANKSGLTSGKNYYFKIRSYKKTADGYIYSFYSSPVRIKIK